MGRHAAAAAVMLVFAIGGSGCGSQGAEVAVLDTVVVTWPGADGSTDGQVVVAIRNDTDRNVDPDVLGRGRQTSARLVDENADEISGGDALVQLHAAPAVLAPGEDGYLLGAFSLPPGSPATTDANVEVNADDVDAPPRVDVLDLEVTEGDDGVGATGELDWDGSGTAVVRLVALDDHGRPIGWTGTSQVRYAPGPFTACCFPPTVSVDGIDDLRVFGSQAVDQG